MKNALDCFEAGWPDQAQRIRHKTKNQEPWLLGHKWFGVLNFPDLLGNGTVAGKPAGRGEVPDHLAGS